MQRNAVDRLDFGRTGKDRYAAHDEGIANHIVFIQRNSDDNPRFKAAAGTPDAHAAFLAQGIKGAVKLMDFRQPPNAIWQSQARAATVMSAVTISAPQLPGGGCALPGLRGLCSQGKRSATGE